MSQPLNHTLQLHNLSPSYNGRPAVRPLSLTIEPRSITAMIGPSGCGKSTVLRCLNRLHEEIPGARVAGQVLLDGEDLYAPGVDPALVRRKIGMVFQLPVVLRTRSIYENLAIGLRIAGERRRSVLDAAVERALRDAALWDEVKNKLRQPATALSGGQQQRLSIARALLVGPDVLLLDEPCAALDPISTGKIEDLLLRLRERLMIVIVTHNMQQAARIADRTAVFMVDRSQAAPVGELVEYDATPAIFTAPKDQRTADYITGRVG
jgi:phosphate transport system ATP-binding protein